MTHKHSFLLSLILLFSIPLLFSQEYAVKLDSILTASEKEADDTLKVLAILENRYSLAEGDSLLSNALLFHALEISRENGSSYIQQKIDYHQGELFYQHGELDKAYPFYKQVFNYWKSENDTIEFVNAKLNLISLDYDMQDFQWAVKNADSLAIFCKQYGLEHLEFKARSLAGLCHDHLENNLLALENYQQCANYFEQIADTGRWADNLSYMGAITDKLKQYSRTKKLYKKCIELYSAKEDWEFLALVQHNLGTTYLASRQFDSADIYISKSLQFHEANQFPLRIAENQAQLGLLEKKKGNYSKAREYIQKAITVFREVDYHYWVIDLDIALGEMQMDRSESEAGFRRIKASEALAENTAGPKHRMGVYKAVSDAYKKKGMHQLAGEYLSKHLEIKDSVYNSQEARKLNELQIIYDTERKEKEILLQKQENENLRKAAELHKIQIRNLWIVSALILGIGILALIIYRQKTIREQLIQKAEKKELERELEFKHRELTTHTLHLVSKNKLLTGLKESLVNLKTKGEDTQAISSLVASIDHDLRTDNDWENFEKYFREVYTDFDEKIKRAFSELTGNEIRLITLMKMNLSSKEIAGILNITPESVNKARYRLRKKLKLDKDQTLQQFILAL